MQAEKQPAQTRTVVVDQSHQGTQPKWKTPLEAAQPRSGLTGLTGRRQQSPGVLRLWLSLWCRLTPFDSVRPLVVRARKWSLQVPIFTK